MGKVANPKVSSPKPRVRTPSALGKDVEVMKCARCGEVCAKEGFEDGSSVPAQTCGCGVWVSWELWHRIHAQLIGKKEEATTQATEHMQSSNRFQSEISVLQQRMQDMEDNFKSRERELKGELLEKQRESVSLKREVEESRMVREREMRETTARAQDLQLQLQDQTKQADDMVAQRIRMQKELDEAHLQFRLADHRAQVAESRAGSMEKEMVHLKDRNGGNMVRIEALEKKAKEAETAANDWRVHADIYKQKLVQHVGPSKELYTEAERLKMDNRRLIGLLEGTDEFRTMMTNCAITRGTHYVTLSECLVEEGWVSEVYAPEMDRPIDVNLEEFHWLPKNAINVTVSFLEEVFPRLPTGPFMHLLMRLSKVWKQHHKDDVARIDGIHKKEVGELRRALDNQKPYYAVHAQDKIRYLKKNVKQNENLTKAEKNRRRKDKESYSEDSRVMLKFGLGTMENLSKQVGEMLQENKALRSQLFLGSSASAGASPLSPQHGLLASSPTSMTDSTSYRALISPRSRARSPARTAYGSPSVPLRSPQAAMEGFWASTPLGQVPSTSHSDGLPTEPTKPYFDKAQNKKDRVANAGAARRVSLNPEDSITKFKRADA